VFRRMHVGFFPFDEGTTCPLLFLEKF